MRLIRCFALVVCAACLAACGPQRKSVFPPSLTVQQMQVLPSGMWRLTVRIQNNSYGGMDFSSIEGSLQVANDMPVRLHAAFDRDIPSFAGDVIAVDVLPTATMGSALAAVAAKGSAGSLAYAIRGTIHAQPDLADHPDNKNPQDFPFQHSDFLSPVPGIANTFR
ncbi:hypothetical protein [Rhodanobacter hydrolyticus]|uniref:Late embryogenesis abundant protein LEA-2 subgroup domain-containing protein n=1 Tax=Rhodanobacter hydrolyticus TaxID=2250595 RepID=A0ABW8J579_9GAMM